MCWWLYLFGIIWILTCWVLYRFGQHKMPNFFKNGFKKKGNILFVVAHPDDECMFFGPAIIACSKPVGKRTSKNVSVLCLSNGNHYGLGEVRKAEFISSCKILGIPERNIHLSDVFKDDPNELWDSSAISEVLAKFSKNVKVDRIFTFDEYGVSGHLNHRALYHGVREFSKRSGIACYALESVSLLRKYIGFADLPFAIFSADAVVASKENRSLIQEAMKAHASQLVWFRKLYVKFSRYMYFNTFQKIS